MSARYTTAQQIERVKKRLIEAREAQREHHAIAVAIGPLAETFYRHTFYAFCEDNRLIEQRIDRYVKELNRLEVKLNSEDGDQ